MTTLLHEDALCSIDKIMGKKRVTQLLEQLKDNQQQELQNAAAIFTVAQVAVNQLQQAAPAAAVNLADDRISIAALPPAPMLLNQAELLQRYGSYRGCRKAAKAQGIKFSRTPSWKQLVAAFSYVEACRQVIQTYVAAHPSPDLRGVSIELKLN
jgi:hypothetical protein